MRRSFAIGIALLFPLILCAGLAFAPVCAAQGPPSGSFDYVRAADQAKAGQLSTPALATVLAGTWLQTLSPPPGPGVPPPFPALTTFAPDGAIIESDALSPSPGQGTWIQTGPTTFAFTFVKLLFGPQGQFTGMMGRVSAAATLNSTLDGYTSQGRAEIMDPTGKVVAAFDAPGQATRLRAQ